MEQNRITSLLNIKRGTQTLFFTQIFSTFSFSILFSTLVLYGTDKLKLAPAVMTTLMGSYVAFNYGLRFIGGYMGGKLISNRSLFLIGTTFQGLACFIIAQTTFTSLMLGLSVFLTGSGLNVTCINNMITQLFDKPKDPRREKAFLWNYSGMNVGFFFGVTTAGYCQIKQNYGTLFPLGGITSLMTALLVLVNWKLLKDTGTFLTEQAKQKQKAQFLKGICVIALILLSLVLLLKHAYLSNILLAATGAILIIAVAFIATLKTNKDEQNKMLVFAVLIIASLIFWSLYLLMPMGLMIFIAHNVNMKMLGFEIAPQWAMNINTIVVVFGGPILGWGLIKLRKKGCNISVPFLFSTALVLIGMGFIILPIGIKLATANGIVSFDWVFWSYILQSTGELCIAPIGYAMIGELISRKLQGTMMGLYSMMPGLGGIASNYLSIYAIGPKNTNLNPLVTNPGYSNMFGFTGYIALIAGIILLSFTPKLIRIKEKYSQHSNIT